MPYGSHVTRIYAHCPRNTGPANKFGEHINMTYLAMFPAHRRQSGMGLISFLKNPHEIIRVTLKSEQNAQKRATLIIVGTHNLVLGTLNQLGVELASRNHSRRDVSGSLSSNESPISHMAYLPHMLHMPSRRHWIQHLSTCDSVNTSILLTLRCFLLIVAN